MEKWLQLTECNTISFTSAWKLTRSSTLTLYATQLRGISWVQQHERYSTFGNPRVEIGKWNLQKKCNSKAAIKRSLGNRLYKIANVTPITTTQHDIPNIHGDTVHVCNSTTCTYGRLLSQRGDNYINVTNLTRTLAIHNYKKTQRHDTVAGRPRNGETPSSTTRVSDKDNANVSSHRPQSRASSRIPTRPSLGGTAAQAHRG
jgi:hypothetical protein